jgi:hypothetical protein
METLVHVGKACRQAMNWASADVRKLCPAMSSAALRCTALHCAAYCKLPLSVSCDGSEVRRAYYQLWEVLVYLQRWADPSGAASAC